MVSRPNVDSGSCLNSAVAPAQQTAKDAPKTISQVAVKTAANWATASCQSPACSPKQDGELSFWLPLNSDEFLPPVSRWATIGAGLLLASVGIAVGLAAITPSPVTVRSAGVVRPSGEIKLVQAPTAGKVTTISVAAGQSVQLGQAIATLEDSQLQTRKSQLEITIEQGQLQVQQLNAQIANLQSQIQAETNLAAHRVDSAQAELDRIERDYSDKRTIAEHTVREAAANVAIARAEYTAIDRAAAAGALPRIQAESKRQALAAAEARLEQAKTVLNPSSASIDAAEQQISQAQAQGESNLALLNRDREQIIQQKIQIQEQIAQKQQEILQINTQLQQTVVRATAPGEVLQLTLRNSGQVVQPGEVIAQIAPQQTALVIKAKVSPEDIGKVKVGQRVNLRVSAFSYADYGTLGGTVTAIAADAMTAPPGLVPGASLSVATQASSPAYFEVTIQPEQPYLVQGDRQYQIRSGMEVQADIVAREETMLTFVLRKARLLIGV